MTVPPSTTADSTAKAPPTKTPKVTPPTAPAVMIVRALAGGLSLPPDDALDYPENDAWRSPTDPLTLEAALIEQFELVDLGKSCHMVVTEGQPIQLHPALRRPGASILQLRRPGCGEPFALTYNGCVHASDTPRFMLNDDRTRILADQAGGVVLAVGDVSEAAAWRGLGVAAIPLRALAEASTEKIAQFWKLVAEMPPDDGPDNKRREAEIQSLEKEIRERTNTREDAEFRIQRLRLQMQRDWILCAPTVTPTMQPSSVAVDLLRRLSLFAPPDRVRVAQWEPSAFHLERSQFARDAGARDASVEAFHESLREDMRFLAAPAGVSRHPETLAELSAREPHRPRSKTAYRTRVEQEIVAPLLLGDDLPDPLARSLRLADAAIVREIAAIGDARETDGQQASDEARIRQVNTLASALHKCVKAELELRNDQRG